MSTQHMLLTNQQLCSRPDSIQIVEDYGKLKIVISEEPWETFEGNNVIVGGTSEDFIKWLSPYDGVYVNLSGNVMLEEFTVVHIKPELVVQ